jgi:hypothetical protein
MKQIFERTNLTLIIKWPPIIKSASRSIYLVVKNDDIIIRSCKLKNRQTKTKTSEQEKQVKQFHIAKDVA